jgi:hypothetical protein
MLVSVTGAAGVRSLWESLTGAPARVHCTRACDFMKPIASQCRLAARFAAKRAESYVYIWERHFVLRTTRFATTRPRDHLPRLPSGTLLERKVLDAQEASCDMTRSSKLAAVLSRAPIPWRRMLGTWRSAKPLACTPGATLVTVNADVQPDLCST